MARMSPDEKVFATLRATLANLFLAGKYPVVQLSGFGLRITFPPAVGVL